MKKIISTLIALLTLTAEAHAMSYEQAREEALFLTDKMAYELNLTDAQYEAAYEINLDYLMSVTSRDNVFGLYWDRRNADLNSVLYAWQWSAFCTANYFYRPLVWDAGYWHFTVYRRYPHRTHFYFGRPHFYTTYRGAHGWHMNGGRSYYAHHHHVYRPEISHDRHIGMRDHWNRGGYQSHHSDRRSGHSSTRLTDNNRHTHHATTSAVPNNPTHHGAISRGSHTAVGRSAASHQGAHRQHNKRGTVRTRASR